MEVLINVFFSFVFRSSNVEMGFSVNKFVTNVDPNLICNICTGIMKQAVVTLCGHSFCHACLCTWLTKPETESCPVCRAYTSKYEIIPNISLRSIIRVLPVWCDNKENGCKIVVNLEGLESHTEVCEYRDVECIACKIKLPYCDLANHCINCSVIEKQLKKSVNTDDDVITMDMLTRKIAVLELELNQSKKELEKSRQNANNLEHEIYDLQQQSNTLGMSSIPEFDPDYSYGYSPSSISQLSCLIAKYLLSKPHCIDRNRIFMAIKRSFTYYHNYAGYAEDVHMLLTTAYASNWFPEHHRWTLERWLEQIAYERFPRQLRSTQTPTTT